MDQLRTLYRPVGFEELQLIQASAMRQFPPRLPEQPIFYPVLTHEYAQQIAKQWNTKDSGGRPTRVGFVTAFDLPTEYLKRYEERTVGSTVHRELWVPAEELEIFNREIRGRIRVVDVFYGDEYQGLRYDLEALNTVSDIKP
jgi:hypothetical protein